MIHADADKIISAAKLRCLEEGKPTLSQMLGAVQFAAYLREGEQFRRLVADYAIQPNADVIAHVVQLDAVGSLIENITNQPDQVARWLRQRAAR